MNDKGKTIKMFNKSGFFIVLLLSYCLVGCSSRYVRFTSEPAGAQISIGNVSSTTPCRLKVPRKIQEVDFTLPDGRIKTVVIPQRTSLEKAKEGVGITGAYLSKGVAFAFAIVGGLGLIVAESNEDEVTVTHDEQEEQYLLGLSAMLAGFAGWYIFHSTGEKLEAMNDQHVHAVFERDSTIPQTEPSELENFRTNQYDLNYKPEWESGEQ